MDLRVKRLYLLTSFTLFFYRITKYNISQCKIERCKLPDRILCKKKVWLEPNKKPVGKTDQKLTLLSRNQPVSKIPD